MPRFVLLVHDWPAPHLDLLIERDGTLKAWRAPAAFDPDTVTMLESNADHRVRYLDYEGPVSGGRGAVSRVETGSAEWDQFEPERCIVRLHGQRLRGRFGLTKRGDAWEWRREA